MLPENIVWVVSEKDEPFYERDDHDMLVYPQDWAHTYAAEHWLDPASTPEKGGFLGAFPGREYACQLAEKRGCWGVLQLDDNIVAVRIPKGTRSSTQVVNMNGGMGLVGDLLSGAALSTNARMVGAQLSSIPYGQGLERTIVRPGFPYSLFIEKVGAGREHWFGPFEDDITHAYQYGSRADGATSAVMPFVRYQKESSSRTGMRAQYNYMRAVQLQRMFPQSAKIGIRRTTSNGRGEPRVFHTMLAGAIKNPVTVLRRSQFDAVKHECERLLGEWHELQLEANREKVAKRCEKLTS